MRFASLGSGSQGNCLIVDAGDTKLLLDCGFSIKATLEKLARLAVSPEELAGVLVTHEHRDHIVGVFKFASRYSIPVYLTHGTYVAAARSKSPRSECHLIDSHAPFSIGSLEIHPFPVPHDAREPVQYVFFNGAHRLGVLTDSGSITPHMVAMLQVCDALVLECNHDQKLLASSDYPVMLKRRIAGDFGHLDNTQAAFLLAQIETRQLQHIVAAHLSEHNNRPEIAVSALAAALDCTEDWIGVACQQRGFGWRELT